MNIFRVRELAGRAYYTTVELERRWNRARQRQMIHQLGRNARVLQVFLDLRGICFVDLLCAGTASGCSLP